MTVATPNLPFKSKRRTRPVRPAFVLILTALCLSANVSHAVSCPVIHHPPPSDADKALLSADYAKAATLYQDLLAKNHGDPDATAGLVHALLRQQKVQEAEDALKPQLMANPNSAALLTLRGEIEFRAGAPWDAAKSLQPHPRSIPAAPACGSSSRRSPASAPTMPPRAGKS
jgi:tetratricopeptide (TPR) repeat protein